MSDINCPYCGKGQEINHDDGVGYSEDEIHQQECCDCEKVFCFTTSVHFYYDARKADCLNGESHNYKKTATCPSWWSKMECRDCGDRREPTEQERIDLGIPDIPSRYLS